MPATTFRLTRRGRVVFGALAVVVAVALLAGVVHLFSHSTKATAFDGPIGELDESKVPHGWGPYVRAAAQEAGLPGPVLAGQLETESHWQVKAVSHVGAQGLAQFTPGTWRTFGKGNPFDPQDAIAAQGRLMKYLMDQAASSHIPRNHIELALAGYNAGFGNVVKYRGIPPFAETQNYVTSVAQKMRTYAKPVQSTK